MDRHSICLSVYLLKKNFFILFYWKKINKVKTIKENKDNKGKIVNNEKDISCHDNKLKFTVALL